MEQTELQGIPCAPAQEEAKAGVRQLKKQLRRQANKSGLILLLFILLTNLLAAGFSWLMVTLVQGRLPGTVFANLTLIGTCVIQYLIVVPVLVGINQLGGGRKAAGLFVRPQGSPAFILKWIVIGFGLSYAVNYLFNFFFLFLQAFGIEMHPITFSSDGSALGQTVTFIALAILAPFMEELLFRGGILQNIRPFGELPAILVSAVLFGLLHMNYVQIFYAMAMGGIAGFLCCKTKSIWPAIGLHFSLNLIGALQTLLLGGIDLELITQMDGGGPREMLLALSEQLLPMMLVVVLAMLCLALCITGVVLFILEMCKNRASLRLENGCPGLTAGQKFAAVATAPAMILFVAFTLAMTVINGAGLSLFGG